MERFKIFRITQADHFVLFGQRGADKAGELIRYDWLHCVAA